MDRYLRLRDKVLRRARGKTVLLSRYGAFGDLIMLTPVLRQLKKEGYYVVLNAQGSSRNVLTCNPNIDDQIIQVQDEIQPDKLDEYWAELSKGFDRFINLNGSIEGDLLKTEGTLEFSLLKEKRHELCNKNYIDHTMKIAGYDIIGAQPEMFFSKIEHQWARKLIKKLKHKYLILWSLSGSSYHKAWPYTEYVATEFLDAHPDTHVITVGDLACKLLEWEHPRTYSWSDNITIRKAMILTQYADLVIGTETGLLNAASCFDTPKIIMLSHSSEENLTKHWRNVEAVNGNTHCYPCHQLHYSKKSCPLNSATQTPLCMTMIRPEQVLLRMEKFYNESRRAAA